MGGSGWAVYRTTEGAAGTGDWSAFNRSLVEIRQLAEGWRAQLTGVERPWLCWNVHDEWCLLQQRLVLAVNWTPVVGWDTNNGVGVPPLMPGAVPIDFNRGLALPSMWMHFPLEFAFLWADRLAFWHSDLLVRLSRLRRLARRFERLRDGELAAVPAYGTPSRPLSLFRIRQHRYFELIGCTTRGASEDQFLTGCGWWRNFHDHPQCHDESERRRRARYHYEHGVGVMYWARHHRGRVRPVAPWGLREGHFAHRVGGNTARLSSKTAELTRTDVRVAAAKLGLDHLL